MAAGVYNGWVIEKNGDFRQRVLVNNPIVDPITGAVTPGAPVDLSGAVLSGGIKANANDGARAAEFDFDIVDPLVDPLGGFYMSMPLAVVQTIRTTGENYQKVEKYWYEVDITWSTGLTDRMLNGLMPASPGV